MVSVLFAWQISQSPQLNAPTLKCKRIWCPRWEEGNSDDEQTPLSKVEIVTWIKENFMLIIEDFEETEAERDKPISCHDHPKDL